MKNISIILFVIILCLGCNNNESDNFNRLKIKLINSDDITFFRKTVILFEDDDYLIKTNFDIYINEYPYNVLYGFDEIKIQAIQDTSIYDTLFMTNYLRKSNDSTYILAYHLENGSCLVYDKKNKKIIDYIEMEEFLEGEPMQSTGGRRFYINGVLFLESIDLIS
jgi:hypothetical protein